MDIILNILLMIFGLLLLTWGHGKIEDSIAKKTADELERRQLKIDFLDLPLLSELIITTNLSI